ncbi:MAG: hypothetical protein ACRDWA_15345 [Acidimicrobiia bacterium]
MIYAISLRNPQPCFLDRTAHVEVVVPSQPAFQVTGAPADTRVRGVVGEEDFKTLDGSQPSWSLQNWCGESGQVVIFLADFAHTFQAGGRCDDPDAPPDLGTAIVNETLFDGFVPQETG